MCSKGKKWCFLFPSDPECPLFKWKVILMTLSWWAQAAQRHWTGLRRHVSERNLKWFQKCNHPKCAVFNQIYGKKGKMTSVNTAITASHFSVTEQHNTVCVALWWHWAQIQIFKVFIMKSFSKSHWNVQKPPGLMDSLCRESFTLFNVMQRTVSFRSHGEAESLVIQVTTERRISHFSHIIKIEHY